MWIFTQNDPAVRVELTLRVSQAETVVYQTGNGAPEPAVTEGSDDSNTYLWVMENLPRMGMPHIGNPAVAEPYVAWSTWRDWETLGGMVSTGFDGAAVLTDEMADTLASRIEHEPTPMAKTRKIAALVEEFARGIRYDSRFWLFAPRPASRTWETAYGHTLDRAVLAAALFRGAGFSANPVYRTSGLGGLELDVPALSWFGDMVVRVKSEGQIGYYDPAHGTVSTSSRDYLGRALWMPGNRPPHINEPDGQSRYVISMTVEPGKEEEWTGSGFVSADGLFCPYDEMAGFEGEALAHIGRVTTSMIDGAKADGFNPESFGTEAITGGFAFHLDKPQANDHGRMALVIGTPEGGIASRLPFDVHLYNETRTSPVMLSGRMTQRVTLRIKTDGYEVVQTPDARDLENDAGRFTLRVTQKDGWTTIDRELTLTSDMISPEDWPALRALLLEDADISGRAVYLK
jgi:hypothetical protein